MTTRKAILPCPDCHAQFEGGQQVDGESSRLRSQREFSTTCGMPGSFNQGHEGARGIELTDMEHIEAVEYLESLPSAWREPSRHFWIGEDA